jgi:hypothetical protein
MPRAESDRAWAVSLDCTTDAERERVAVVLVGALRGPETATLPWTVGSVERIAMGAALDIGLLKEALFISAV